MNIKNLPLQIRTQDFSKIREKKNKKKNFPFPFFF